MGIFHPLNWILTAVLWGLIFGAWHYAHGRELYPGQYAQVSPAERQWFKEQKVPGTGSLCCNEADGANAEEDIRPDGAGIEHYWVKFAWWFPEGGVTHEMATDWTEVPEGAVLDTPNRHGTPVVWWQWLGGSEEDTARVKIRCFSPGAKG
jgi:hypothetical protein